MAGLPLAGSVAFGAAWGATGLLFAAVGGIAAQLSVSARAATGLGLVVLAVAYVARAVGDLAEGGPGWLSWLSPIGWSQAVRAFSGTRWQMLVLPLVAAVVLAVIAFVLRARRDLGAGVLADRPGPAEGRISTTWGLSWRLQRPSFAAWTVAAVIMGVVLGSVADSVSGFIDTPAMAEFLERLGGRQGLVDAFLAAELGIIGSLVAAYGITATHWLPSEEQGGRTENVLATATTRRQWATSHAVLALLGVAVLTALVGLAVGLGHALSVGEPDQVWRLGVAATARIPAAWVVVGLAVAIWGFWPRVSWVVWVLFVAFLVMGEFGVLWDLPAWVRNMSPFAHSPVVPGPDPQYLGVPVMLVIAGGLVALGIARFARRDVVSS
jgi:ABC-2 type transport system permease protein